MIRIPLPLSDTVLLLTLRWKEMSAGAQVASILFCLLVPTILVLLYRYELFLVRRRTATVLLGLRMIVIFFLLCVVFLQPIVARSKTEELQGRVLLAIDRSDSMKVADPQRSPADKLRLARALKVAGDVSNDRLDRWIKQAEDKSEPVWVDKEEFPDNLERRRQLEGERRKQYTQIIQNVDQLSRLGIVQKVLAKEGGDLLDAIGQKHKVEILSFAQETGDLKAEQLDELFVVPPSGGSAARPPEGGTTNSRGGATDSTDLRLPLIRALERSGKAEGKILGVVLLTDGQHNKYDNEGQTPVTKAIEMGQQEIPVYPIAIGAKLAPPDVAVASVRAPAAAFKDVDVPVEARVKISGLKKQEVVLELTQAGKPPLTERIAHDGNDRYHTVRFQVKLDQVGTQTLTVTAKPVEGEIRSDNNSKQVAINVADDKAKVLLVDGEARWEYHYLANALLRDRTMETQSIVFIQPRLGRVPEEDLEKLGNPRLQWPSDADALASFDCIVLGDVSPAQLPAAERLRLEKYVADRGGTLVILAGKRFMPMGFLASDPRLRVGLVGEGKGRVGDDTDPLLKLLPILEPHVVKPVKGFPVTLTHQGKLATYMQMETAPDKSLSRWADLPPHFWGVIGKAKPGATTLAYIKAEDLGGSRAESPESRAKQAGPALGSGPSALDIDRDQALIVRQNYGFGRVLYIGLESTWRWRYKTGDTYHHRFWGQVIRWAAADKPLVAGNEHIRFGTREPVYRQGSEVDLIVRLGENEKPLGANALAAARIIRVEGEGKEIPSATVQLERKAAQPRVLEGKAPPYLPAGQYVIELAIPELAGKLDAAPNPDGNSTKLRASFTILPTESEEMIELGTNYPLLGELAAKSGGQVFTPENASELVELLTKKTVTRERPVENKLWEEWASLVIFLVLLTAEWVIRKLAGLP